MSVLAFPKDGVTLAVIVTEFIELCGGQAVLLGLTTTEVNERFQKEMTRASGLSYCEQLKLAGHQGVGWSCQGFYFSRLEVSFLRCLPSNDASF